MKILKESVHILNLKANMLVNEYEVTNNKKMYHFDGALPYSLLTIELQKMGEKFKFEKLTNSYNTYCVVNVDFNCCYKEMKDEDTTLYFTDGKKVEEKKGTYERKMTSQELRKYLYKNGFDLIIDGKKIHYVTFCRSSAKSRVGNRLFIREDLLQHILFDFMRMGITFKEDELLDVPSWLTYESLVCSSIIDTISIDLNNICVVDDIDINYQDVVSVTKLEDGELIQKDELYNIKNCSTDGEMLINSNIAKYCMELWRNHFFKGCGISTDFKRFKEVYHIEKFIDKWGREFEEPDLVITPSCLKLFKFSYKFNSDLECFEYWKTHCSKEFGIVKHNKHSGNYEGRYGQLSYQVLNSLYTANYSDILSLMSDELQYISNLKSEDESYFKLHINTTSQVINDNFINTMSSLNNDFYKTDTYRTYKQTTIRDYIRNLKCSKIKVKDLDYYTIFGLPQLLLRRAAGLSYECNVEGNICYCPSYKVGEELFAWRNPHISPGNLATLKNEYFDNDIEFFDKLHQGNVCIINSGKSSLMDTFSGCDFDSDTIALTPNKTLVRLVKENTMFKAPVNTITSTKLLRHLNDEEVADVDDKIGQNKIGEICNLAALILSYFSDIYYKDSKDTRLKRLSDLCNMMSVASGIEIDKAKKNSDVSAKEIIKFVRNELNDILEKETIIVSKQKLTIEEMNEYEKTRDKSILTKEKDALIKPMFFKFAQADYSNQYSFRLFNCPSDYVVKVLDDFNTRMKRTNKIELNSMFIKNKDYEHANRKQVKVIIQKIISYKHEFTNIQYSKCDALEKMILREELQTKFYEEMSKLKVTSETIYCILVRMFNNKYNDEFIKNKRMTLEEVNFLKYNKQLVLRVLCDTHREQFKECFMNYQQETEVLVEDENGTITIWGKKYSKVVL